MMDTVLSNATPQNEMGKLVCDIMDLTVFNEVIFFLSATSFCCGVKAIVN